MKKSTLQYIAGGIGMFLVVLGVVWSCKTLSTPRNLNAALPRQESQESDAFSSSPIRPVAGEKTTLKKSTQIMLDPTAETEEISPAVGSSPNAINSNAVGSSAVGSNAVGLSESGSRPSNVPSQTSQTVPAPLKRKGTPLKTSSAQENSPSAASSTALSLAPSTTTAPSTATEDSGDTQSLRTSTLPAQSIGAQNLSAGEKVALISDSAAPLDQFAQSNPFPDGQASDGQDLPFDQNMTFPTPSLTSDDSSDISSELDIPRSDDPFPSAFPEAENAASGLMTPMSETASNLETQPNLETPSPFESTPDLESTNSEMPNPGATVNSATPNSETAANLTLSPLSSSAQEIPPEASSLDQSFQQTPMPAETVVAAPNVFPVNASLSESAQPSESVRQLAVPGAREIEGTQQAQLTIEKEIPDEVQVGQETTMTLILKNVGSQVAKNVVLKDRVPLGSTLVSTTPQTQSALNGELVWAPFDLESGHSAEFSYKIVPQEEGEIGSVATVGFDTNVSGKTRCTRPQLKLEVNAPKEVLIGENVTFDIVISNPGTGTATGVVLVENIPDGLRHPSGTVLDNQIGELAPQASKTISLSLESVKPGVIENFMTIKGDHGLYAEASSQIQVNAPELQLTIDGAKTRYLEKEAQYKLTVSNPGTAVAQGVELVAELPKNVQFVSTNNRGAYDETAHCVRWALSELPNQVAPGEIELNLMPKEFGNGIITFRGKGEKELMAEVSQDIVVDGLAAVSFEVTALTDPVEVGKDAIYQVTLSNRGTKESTNLALQVLLPEGMKILATDGPTRCSEVSGGVTFDTIDRIPAKSEIVYKMKAVGSETGDHRIRVQLSSDDLDPLIKEESIRVF